MAKQQEGFFGKFFAVAKTVYNTTVAEIESQYDVKANTAKVRVKAANLLTKAAAIVDTNDKVIASKKTKKRK